jgi:hypothetical protein
VTECIDKRFEKMLYAYELGMLSPEDTLALEQHLYECDHCYQNAREFMDAADLLRRSSRVKSEIKRAAHSGVRRTVSRFLLAVAAMVVVAIPIYKLVVVPDQPGVVQTLFLTSMRDNSPAALNLDRGGTADIRFVLDGANQTDTHSVEIAARHGETVYVDAEFSGFNEFGQGVITLPVATFQHGYYVLTITDVVRGDTLRLAQYPFRVQ